MPGFMQEFQSFFFFFLGGGRFSDLDSGVGFGVSDYPEAVLSLISASFGAFRFRALRSLFAFVCQERCTV